MSLGDQLWWWQCADIKVDALEGAVPSYQMPVPTVDYAAFESRLEHRNAQRGKVNRVYVQVHNRGISPAANVTVKLLYANASAGLPSLPADFWTAFPNDSTNTTNWKPIGTAKVIPSLSPTEPVVLEWDWATPVTAADHTCLMAVIDSVSNPIPAANKIFDAGVLVPNEKRVGLKNLHIVDAPAGASLGLMLEFFSARGAADAIRVLPAAFAGWSLGLIWPKTHPIGRVSATSKTRGKARRAAADDRLPGWQARRPAKALLKKLKDQFGADLDRFDTSTLLALQDGEKGGYISNVKIPAAGLRALVVLTPPATRQGESTFTVVQEEGGQVVGGNTFVLRVRRQ